MGFFCGVDSPQIVVFNVLNVWMLALEAKWFTNWHNSSKFVSIYGVFKAA